APAHPLAKTAPPPADSASPKTSSPAKAPPSPFDPKPPKPPEPNQPTSPRSQVSRGRLAGRAVWEMCGERTVDVVQMVSVALDRTALAGLLRAMTFLETRNRQEAARFLLTDALGRFGAFVLLPELRGTKPTPFAGRFT
ncbi:MAG: hypothetical protein H7Y38_16520, partial [Armatimonadetes bacterium]|nr:hypothetical protein [Armatimonadota bacterium]